MASLPDLVKLFFLGLIAAAFTIFVVHGLGFAIVILLGPLGELGPVLFLLVLLALYLLTGIVIYLAAKKLKLKVKKLRDLALNSLLVWAFSLIPIFIFFQLISISMHTLLGAEENSSLMVDFFDAMNPFYALPECEEIDTYVCSMKSLQLLYLRYLIYFGPHNPITLFIGGLIARRFLK